MDDSVTLAEKSPEKIAQSLIAAKYANLCFTAATIILCVIIPLYNRVQLSQRYFKIMHYFRHHFVFKHMWIHRMKLYHNKSLQLCLFWCTFISIFTLYGSQQNFYIIIKKLGRIAVALLPPLLFLTLRPSPLPNTLYLALLPFHKWIARTVVLASFLHSIFYAYIMYSNHVFIEKMKKPANLYGLAAMCLFILIAFSSVSMVRRSTYKVFYYIHYVSTWLVVILLHFHARPGIPYYTAMNMSILVAQIIYRLHVTRVSRATIVRISPSLTLVEFPIEDVAHKPKYPAAHVRLSLCHERSFLVNFFKRFMVPLQHPFTIANLPQDDKIQLIIKSNNFPLINNGKYYVTGAFEPVINFLTKPRNLQDSLSKYRENPFRFKSQALPKSPLNYIVDSQRVLIIVGGTGISFGLPLLRILNFNGCLVRLKWVIRDFRDLKILNHIKNNFEGMEVFISAEDTKEEDIVIDYRDNLLSDSDARESTPLLAHHRVDHDLFKENRPQGQRYMTSAMQQYGLQNVARNNTEDEIDFTDFAKKKKPVLQGIFREPSIIREPSQEESASATASATESASDEQRRIEIPSGVKVYFGRPRLAQDDYDWCVNERECGVNDIANDKRRVWVMAAGPPALIDSASRWATDSGLRFHGESFAV
ncbi:putative ferric reductase transmembrane component 8 [Nakaseomyces bracarensis]|uniref:Ferric reductase transmembrane component 8 n=1 Tax=Nakaseomyces bracarensis TaxID=273131 RepID=A0ABR4NQW6_9SACH